MACPQLAYPEVVTIPPGDVVPKGMLEVPASPRTALFIYGGHFCFGFKGAGPNWRRAQAVVTLPTQGARWTTDQAKIDPRAQPPVVALANQCVIAFATAISNDGPAVNAGWAIDEVGAEISRIQSEGGILETLILRLLIAVRDIDGWMIRIGYQATLLGITVKP